MTRSGKGGGVLDALRRRKVVQWGIAYVAAAWGLLQVAEFVREAFDWPDQIRQLAILVLLIGLPIVLVVAWYHGDQGEQRVRGVELAVIAAMFLLGGAAVWRYSRAVENSTVLAQSALDAATAGSDESAIGDDRPSVTIAPFVNLTGDAANDRLAHGLAESLRTMLAQVSELVVIGPSSPWPLAGGPVNTRVWSR